MTAYANSTGTFSTPVVALHASASSGLQWKHLEHALAGHFDISAPNLPGYGGGSIAPGSDGDGVDAVARPIAGHIATFDQPIHLVGHSFGATVALNIALARPELVRSLTLYEPAAFHFLRFGDARERALFDGISAISDAVSEGCEKGDPARGMQTFIDFWNRPGAWNDMSVQNRNALTALAPSIRSDFAHGFRETWTLEDLSGLAMPVLMLMGMESPVIAQHVATRISDAIPRSRLAMLPGLGHMAPVFEPDWVNPRIHEHIVSAERPAAHCFWPHLSAA